MGTPPSCGVIVISDTVKDSLRECQAGAGWACLGGKPFGQGGAGRVGPVGRVGRESGGRAAGVTVRSG
jgi:hypothetical protein